MQVDAAGTSQSQDSAEVEACRLVLCGCMGSRSASAGDIQPQVPQRKPEPKSKGQFGSANSGEGGGPGNTKGPVRDLDDQRDREISSSCVPIVSH